MAAKDFSTPSVLKRMAAPAEDIAGTEEVSKEPSAGRSSEALPAEADKATQPQGEDSARTPFERVAELLDMAIELMETIEPKQREEALSLAIGLSERAERALGYEPDPMAHVSDMAREIVACADDSMLYRGDRASRTGRDRIDLWMPSDLKRSVAVFGAMHNMTANSLYNIAFAKLGEALSEAEGLL